MSGEPRNPSSVRWRLVVPVQESSRAKSRLQPPDALNRVALARAVAADTLDAVCRALPPQDVTVVTADPAAAALAGEHAAGVVPDPGAGLNAAIEAGLAHAAAAARARDGSSAGGEVVGYAVLLGDLPALRPEDVRDALTRCGAYPAAVVPDADTTGTVLLTALGEPPAPRFGAGSAARHAEGAEVLELDLPRLRRDVDTAGDLATALALGVGPRTAALLAASAWGA